MASHVEMLRRADDHFKPLITFNAPDCRVWCGYSRERADKDKLENDRDAERPYPQAMFEHNKHVDSDGRLYINEIHGEVTSGNSHPYGNEIRYQTQEHCRDAINASSTVAMKSDSRSKSLQALTAMWLSSSSNGHVTKVHTMECLTEGSEAEHLEINTIELPERQSIHLSW